MASGCQSSPVMEETAPAGVGLEAGQRESHGSKDLSPLWAAMHRGKHTDILVFNKKSE